MCRTFVRVFFNLIEPQTHTNALCRPIRAKLLLVLRHRQLRASTVIASVSKISQQLRKTWSVH